jgi:hypothetical protein
VLVLQVQNSRSKTMYSHVSPLSLDTSCHALSSYRAMELYLRHTPLGCCGDTSSALSGADGRKTTQIAGSLLAAGHLEEPTPTDVDMSEATHPMLITYPTQKSTTRWRRLPLTSCLPLKGVCRAFPRSPAAPCSQSLLTKPGFCCIMYT